MAYKKKFLGAADLTIDTGTGAVLVTVGAGGITGSMLADAVAGQILTVTGASVDKTNGTAWVTLTVKDAAGTARDAVLLVWLASDAAGTPAVATNLAILTQGKLVCEHEANSVLSVVTAIGVATGVVDLVVENPADTYYLFAACNGRLCVVTVTITGP